jgi:hypothetical protein
MWPRLNLNLRSSYLGLSSGGIIDVTTLLVKFSSSKGWSTFRTMKRSNEDGEEGLTEENSART